LGQFFPLGQLPELAKPLGKLMKGKFFCFFFFFLNLIPLLLEMQTNVSSFQRERPSSPRQVFKKSAAEGKQIVVSIGTR